MDQRKSPKKKIQFEVPSMQLHGHLDPRSSEQLRKRRPTPATLFLSNDQTSPDDDRDGEHGEGPESRFGHSPRKGGHHSSYTPPTMSQMQTLVELHLHATEEEDEEDLEDIDDDQSNASGAGAGDDLSDGHHGSLVFHVPTGPFATHGERGALGGPRDGAGEPTTEPDAELPTSGHGALGDSAGASGGGGQEGAKDAGKAEEQEEGANVTFEPRRRVTWAHEPEQAAAGPPHLASPPIPTGCLCFPCLPLAPVGDNIGGVAAAAAMTGAGVEPATDGPGPQRGDDTHADTEPGADTDARSAGRPVGRARVQFDSQPEAQPAGQATGEAGARLDDAPLASQAAARPGAPADIEPDSQSDAHRGSRAATAPPGSAAN